MIEAANYEVQRKLGEGGFGETFLATAADGHPVVMKRLRVDRLDDWKAMELFEREARVLEQLDHPNIPNYVDSFTEDDGGGLIIVQDFIEGRTLREVLRAGEPLDEALMTAWFLKMLEVCAYLHALDPPVIHRDINPNNIILRNGDNEPFLIDFGTVQAAIKSESTISSTAAGTFGYAPTEQFIGKAFPSSDLYGLGMTFLAVWTGSEPEAMPFASGAMQLDELLRDRPMDGRLRIAIERMIDRVPENRPGSADEVLSRLSALRASTSVAPKQLEASVDDERLSLHNPWLAAKARGASLGSETLGEFDGADNRGRYVENWALSADSKLMVLSWDGAGRLFDVDKMELVRVLHPMTDDDALGFAPDNSFFIGFDGWDETMRRFDLVTGGDGEVLPVPEPLQSSDFCGPDASVAISPDGKLGALGSPLSLFSPETGALIRQTDVESEGPPQFSPDGQYLIGVGDEHIAIMATDGRERRVKGTAIALTPGGRRAALAVCGSKCGIHIGDWNTLASSPGKWFDKTFHVPNADDSEIRHMAWDPTGRFLAFGVECRHQPPDESDWGWDHRVHVIDTETGEFVCEFGDPSRGGRLFDSLYGLGFDSQSRRLFVFAYCYPTVFETDKRKTLLVYDFRAEKLLVLANQDTIRTPEGLVTDWSGKPQKKADIPDEFQDIAVKAALGFPPESHLEGKALDQYVDLAERVAFARGLFASPRDGGVALPAESDVRPFLEATRGLTHMLPWIAQEATRIADALPAFGAKSNEAPPVRIEHLVEAAKKLAARGESERDALFDEMNEVFEDEIRAKLAEEAERKRRAELERQEAIEVAAEIKRQRKLGPGLTRPPHHAMAKPAPTKKIAVIVTGAVVSIIVVIVALFLI